MQRVFFYISLFFVVAISPGQLDELRRESGGKFVIGRTSKQDARLAPFRASPKVHAHTQRWTHINCKGKQVKSAYRDRNKSMGWSTKGKRGRRRPVSETHVKGGGLAKGVRSRPGILPASLIGYPAKCGKKFIDKGTDRDTHSSARLYNNINALDEEAKHDKCENFFNTQRKMRGTCSVTITRLIVSFLWL